MRLGLVEYTGLKTASFQVEVKGGKPYLWAHGPQRDTIKQRRWLPEREAREYDRFPEFRIIRWGTDGPTEVATPQPEGVQAGWIPPAAAHVSTFINQAPEEPTPSTIDEPEEETEVQIEGVPPQYIMSGSGTVHNLDCVYGKKILEPIQFQTLEEAAVHPAFTKYCKCIVGE